MQNVSSNSKKSIALKPKDTNQPPCLYIRKFPLYEIGTHVTFKAKDSYPKDQKVQFLTSSNARDSIATQIW